MTIPQYRQTPYWLQLLYLLLISVGCAIIGVVVSLTVIAGIYGRGMAWNVMMFTNDGSADFIAAFRIFLGLGNTLFTFFVSAVIFAYYIAHDVDGYLQTRNYFSPLLILVAIGFMLFFLPVIDITGYLNQNMKLPPSLHGLDKWIHDSENQNETVIKQVLNMPNVGDLLISIFIVGFLPALSEEFFFRGCMQSVFERWIKNTHVAVWTTAFLFSFFHFEFLGFVPRMLLGAALGYFFTWSGSIWPSVVVHFLNNSVSVVAYYLYQHKIVSTNPDSNMPMFSQMWIYVVCFVVSVLFMLLYRRITLATPYINGEELD